MVIYPWRYKVDVANVMKRFIIGQFLIILYGWLHNAAIYGELKELGVEYILNFVDFPYVCEAIL
jgi:hypothetical protein